eukprot:CCRYP_020884-RA/>CCRYP_020884-RA protein AED:0.26 eAED:0.26 QI:0/-1/0/1/-1/1/1/0/226
MPASQHIPSAKKRKVDTSNSHADAPSRVKKSPLADLPQNYYAPPVHMTKEELSAWRKEQRRERNRQSAADSRNKTKLRIEELEGEVAKYKTLYEDMKKKMGRMEHQIRVLTELNKKIPSGPCLRASSPAEQRTVTPPGSYPNSPSISPVPSVNNSPPTATTLACPVIPSFFPPLLSTLADYAPTEITSQPLAGPTTATGPLMEQSSSFRPTQESKEHLIKPISRQA